jgi:hypothetical protein
MEFGQEHTYMTSPLKVVLQHWFLILQNLLATREHGLHCSTCTTQNSSLIRLDHGSVLLGATTTGSFFYEPPVLLQVFGEYLLSLQPDMGTDVSS